MRCQRTHYLSAVMAAAGLLVSVIDLPSSGAFLLPSSASQWRTPSAAFPPVPGGGRSTIGELHETTRETEKVLRNEIAERNSKVDDERRYAILDGEGVSTPASSSKVADDASRVGTADSTAATDQQRAKLERLIKQRPYGLFLAEKVAEIIEDAVEGAFGKRDLPEGQDPSKRERIVVLGTGWGAAAFLKGIDTRQFDVTVISPRNYFVFTPMLAGASVGTVDYRSITEPVREVRQIC